MQTTITKLQVSSQNENIAQKTKERLFPIKISKYTKIQNPDNEGNHKLNSSSYTLFWSRGASI